MACENLFYDYGDGGAVFVVAESTKNAGDAVFKDREEAGEKLARALRKYKGKDVVVLAIPKGGVCVGFQIADRLDADFAIIVVRKLPFPENPESGFGAIAEDGSTFIIDEAVSWVPAGTVEEVKREQEKEIQRRIKVLRNGRPLPDLAGRTVILVDDGIAMGSTMRAAVACCRRNNAGKIIVASPVSGAEIAGQMRGVADEVLILESPPFFRAVAEVYEEWYDVSDEEVTAVMGAWREKIRKRKGRSDGD